MSDHRDLAPNEAIARTLARHPRPLGGDTLRSTGDATLSLTDRILNNRSGSNVDSVIQQLEIRRKPDWLRAKMPGGEGYIRLKKLLTKTNCTRFVRKQVAPTWANVGVVAPQQ